jgi:hypothetical protein
VVPEPGEDAGEDGVAIVAAEPPERHVRASLDLGDEAPAALATVSPPGWSGSSISDCRSRIFASVLYFGDGSSAAAE